MDLYEQLEESKRNGNMLQLDYDTLVKLWWDEANADGAIAKLFGRSKDDITKLRHKWEINNKTMSAKDIKRVHDNIPLIGEEGKLTESVDKVIELIDKLDYDEENALVKWLVENITSVNEMAKGNRRYKAIIKG